MLFFKLYWKHLTTSLFLAAALCAAVFFGKINLYHLSVPVKFDRKRTPYIDLCIQGARYPIVLDTGSKLQLKLFSEHTKNIKKTHLGFETYKNFKGAEHKRSSYRIEKLQIGSLTFYGPTFVEDRPADRKAYTVYSDGTKKSPPVPVGTIGRGFLKKVNLLLDSKNSKLLLSNSFFRMKRDGYDLRKYLRVPFEMTPKGMIVDVSTDLGLLRLLVDTGCTKTMLHLLKYPGDISKARREYNLATMRSKAFSLQGLDYGGLDLYFIKMAEELESAFDGILGMDFIEDHVMYIDFTKGVIYLERP